MVDRIDYQRMNRHRRMKPGERMPAQNGHEAYIAQGDVHDAVRDQKEMRAASIKENFDRWVAIRPFTAGPNNEAMPAMPSGEEVFEAGFTAGEQHGHTVGFAKGATTTIGQLTHSKGKGRVRTLQSGNWLGEPETKLEAINSEQLTAEICALLAAYAVVRLDLKIAAVIDALNTLPGVDLRFGPRPDTSEEKTL